MNDFGLSYSEMLQYKDLGDRLQYLSLRNKPHSSPRSVSQSFYKSKPWLAVRSQIIKRDLGCDLGVMNSDIDGPILVHHINPITEYDIENWTDKLLDPENLISVSLDTHNAIHYKAPVKEHTDREENDTKLW